MPDQIHCHRHGVADGVEVTPKTGTGSYICCASCLNDKNSELHEENTELKQRLDSISKLYHRAVVALGCIA